MSTPNPTLAAKMRTSAESGLAAANERIAELKARTPNTYKRVTEAKHGLKQAWEQWMAATTLANLADAAEAGTLPGELADLKTWNAVQRKFIASYDHRKALGPYTPPAPKDELLFKIWDLVGSKIPGYFPTPVVVVNQLMGLYADPLEGVRVLEPSAGSGNIADWLRESGALVECAEANYTLHEILTLKGHQMIGRDALSIEGQWPLIVMNPPFERLQDAEHVRHAYEHNLAPGGTLLAIIGGGTLTAGCSKRHKDFQEWFRERGGHWEPLPAGSFEESGTGVATTMIVLQKPEEDKDDDDPSEGELHSLAYDDARNEEELTPHTPTNFPDDLPPHERPLDILATAQPPQEPEPRQSHPQGSKEAQKAARAAQATLKGMLRKYMPGLSVSMRYDILIKAKEFAEENGLEFPYDMQQDLSRAAREYLKEYSISKELGLVETPEECKKEPEIFHQIIPEPEQPPVEPELGAIPMLIGASKARRLRWWTEEFGDRTDELTELLGRDPDVVEEYNYMSLIAMHDRVDCPERARMLREAVAFARSQGQIIPPIVAVYVPETEAAPVEESSVVVVSDPAPKDEEIQTWRRKDGQTGFVF